jgi:hypothetical protein
MMDGQPDKDGKARDGKNDPDTMDEAIHNLLLPVISIHRHYFS